MAETVVEGIEDTVGTEGTEGSEGTEGIEGIEDIVASEVVACKQKAKKRNRIVKNIIEFH